MALTGSIIAFAAVAGPAVGDSLPTAAFAIGDGNAQINSSVTFWGSRWWKDNIVSTGTAPASFKGYAVDVDPSACTFTTTTGNSAPPPDGPLPPVVTVLVTKAVTQSGSTISGTVTEFALVATNPGYDSNPGHAGTGTVISFIPCGDHGPF
ncbi:MAG: hypothetical protein ACXVY6_14240 [Gaiellaceae bacterium]